MATETSGDSKANASDSSSTTKSFFFRPSALSDVADKMWKKANADSGSSVADCKSKLFSLAPLTTLSSSGNSFLNCTSSTPSSPFIFGKNISRRVAHATEETEGKASSDESKNQLVDSTFANKNDDKKEKESIAHADPRTEVSFDTLAATSTTNTDVSAASNSGTASTMSGNESVATVSEEASATGLEASAAAYEAAKHQTQIHPQLLAPEEVKTGEEEETNVVQSSVKLYVFDTTKQSWADRGQAIIRVNDRTMRPTTEDDAEIMETRIVARLQGSLRVIVNTKLWPEMLLERVSTKRLRLSGIVEDAIFSNVEGEQPAISIYLISASQSSDIDRIETALRDRLARLKSAEQQFAATAAGAASKKRPMSQSSNDGDHEGQSSSKKQELDKQDKN